MNDLRRSFLKRTGGLGALVAAVATGALKPADVLAAARNDAAFEARSTADAMKALGMSGATNSTAIAIRAPDIAENGAVVPIDITSNVPGTRSMSLFVDNNPFPYIGTFDVSKGTDPYVHVRIKMGKSSDVRVVVAAADGKYYQAAKEVKVTIGGCGG
jgi:sulfur-oxidizing protein SoxY